MRATDSENAPCPLHPIVPTTRDPAALPIPAKMPDTIGGPPPLFFLGRTRGRLAPLPPYRFRPKCRTLLAGRPCFFNGKARAGRPCHAFFPKLMADLTGGR